MTALALNVLILLVPNPQVMIALQTQRWFSLEETQKCIGQVLKYMSRGSNNRKYISD